MHVKMDTKAKHLILSPLVSGVWPENCDIGEKNASQSHMIFLHIRKSKLLTRADLVFGSGIPFPVNIIGDIEALGAFLCPGESKLGLYISSNSHPSSRK